MPAVRSLYRLGALAFGVLLCSAAASVRAQAPLLVYTDSLVNGFQDWGWGDARLRESLAGPLRHCLGVGEIGSAWQGLPDSTILTWTAASTAA